MQTDLRKLTVAWPLAIILLLPALTRADTAGQAWVQRYNGPANGNNEANAVAVDGSNNVIVTGASTKSGSGYDYATIKYSSAGIALWTNRYNGPGNGDDEPAAVAVDSGNNVIVTGYSMGSSGYEDYATIKYSSDGVPLWTNRYKGPGGMEDVATAVAVDGGNNVLVTGYSWGGEGSWYDYATIKYSSAGVPLWTNRYNGPGSLADLAYAVAVDGSNNVIVTGASTGGGFSFNYATVEYSSAGVPLWTNRYSGPGNGPDQANAVAVDGSNNVIVTGYSTGSNSYDYATIKYSGAGAPLWTNRYNGPGNGDDEAQAIASDGSNNVIVTGYSAGSNGYFNYNYATLEYSSAGVPLWTNRYIGPANGPDEATAVAVDAGNNVVVTGYSTNSDSGYDYATIKYSSAGVPLWTNRYNGPGNANDLARALAVDHSGNVIVTGYSTGSGGEYDFATVKYLAVLSPVLNALGLTSRGFLLQVADVMQPGTLVIEACANLSTTNWTPVFTNTTPTNVVFYTDPSAANLSTRFYRAFQFP
jgi:uncharacterized delta-60 repeat protein